MISIVETVRNKQISTLERIFFRSGKIISVGCWDGGNIYEISIHLPNPELENWNSAQSIKCRISALHYTDYTPARWDAEKKVCTLYIDASHNGQGSIWAKNQLHLQAVSNYSAIYKQTEYGAVKHQAEKENFVFYVVGGKELILILRILLKTCGFDGNQIKSKGFWH